MWSSLGMLIAAFLPPTARVLGFASGIGVIIAFHYQTIMNLNVILLHNYSGVIHALVQIINSVCDLQK